MSGPINDRNTPSELPNNEWTQMIEAVSMRNHRGTSLSPAEIAAGVPMTGTPMPSVRSAEMGRPVAAPAEDPNRPLTPDEIEELNRAALKSGLIKGPVNQSIANTLGEAYEDSAYGSLEEAIAAGAPVSADEEQIAAGAARFREAVPVFRTPVGDRQSAREFIGRRASTPREFIAEQQASQLPRLPDFKKVQMIDMVNGKVYVDGLEFALGATELKTLRKFCVTKAKDQIQKALDAALADLSEDADDGDSEAVS